MLLTSRRAGTFGFLGSGPAEQLAFPQETECSKKLTGEKKKYKWFIKNLLFMKVKRGASRNRAAVTERPSEAQLLFCLTLGHPRAPPKSWHPNVKLRLRFTTSSRIISLKINSSVQSPGQRRKSYS